MGLELLLDAQVSEALATGMHTTLDEAMGIEIAARSEPIEQGVDFCGGIDRRLCVHRRRDVRRGV